MSFPLDFSFGKVESAFFKFAACVVILEDWLIIAIKNRYYNLRENKTRSYSLIFETPSYSLQSDSWTVKNLDGLQIEHRCFISTQQQHTS